MEWARALVDLKPDVLYSVSKICRIGKFSAKDADKIRLGIKRQLIKLGLSDEYDGFDKLGNSAWYGWKIQMCIPEGVVPDKLRESYLVAGRSRIETMAKSDSPTFTIAESVEDRNPVAPTAFRQYFHKLQLFRIALISLLCFFSYGVWKNQIIMIRFHQKTGDLQWLYSHLHRQEFSEYQAVILSAIADVHRANNGSTIVIQPEKHQATFAFIENPFLLIDGRVLRLGTLVSIDGYSGHISHIGAGYFVLETAAGAREFPLPSVHVFGKRESWPYQVAVRNANASKIIDTLAEINEWSVIGIHDGVVIHGNWNGIQTAENFIQAISADVGISLANGELIFSDAPGVAIGWGKLKAWPMTIARIIREYGQIGVYIDYPAELQSTRFIFSAGSFNSIMEDLKMNASENGESCCYVRIGML